MKSNEKLTILFILSFFFTITAFAEIKPMVVKSIDGKEIAVGKNGDKPELVFILATRCPVSNAYNERMASTLKEYGDRVHIVGVNPNETESNEEVIKHASNHGLTFPIYRDPGMKLTDSWGVRVTPEAYLFDKSGKLVYRGRIDDNQDASQVKSFDLRSALEKHLSGKPVPANETRPFGCSIKRVSK